MIVIANFEEARDANFYYLSGIEEPCEGILLFDESPTVLTTPLCAAIAEKYVEEVISFERFSDLLAFLKKAVKGKLVGMNFDRAPIWLFRQIKAKARKVENIGKVLMQRRRKKTKEEIKKVEKACKIAVKALEKTLKEITPGATELQVAGAFISHVTEEGGYIGFDPIVAFGASTAVPHYFPSAAVTYSKGLNFLLDVSARYRLYCSDLALSYAGRNFAAQQAFEAVAKALETFEDIAAPGMPIGKLVAEVEKYTGRIPHALGHGVGLEVHELPLLSRGSKEKLLPGDVIAVEPAIYGSSFGIRLEQMYVVEEDNLRKLCDVLKLMEKIV